MARRIEVRKGDTIIVGDREVDVTVLEQVLDTDKRVLWAFIERDGSVLPICYSEDRVIWLSEKDVDIGVDA